jgi:hypothetical protein
VTTPPSGRPPHAEPGPAHRPVRLDHPPGDGGDRGLPIFGYAKPVPVNASDCAIRAATSSS